MRRRYVPASVLRSPPSPARYLPPTTSSSNPVRELLAANEHCHSLARALQVIRMDEDKE